MFSAQAPLARPGSESESLCPELEQAGVEVRFREMLLTKLVGMYGKYKGHLYISRYGVSFISRMFVETMLKHRKVVKLENWTLASGQLL